MAINNATIMGRLTTDPELRKVGKDSAVTSFTVAVDRNWTDEEGNRQADFIRCTAWNGCAEFICKYFGKGRMIALTGWIQTGSYENDDGDTVFTTEINVQQVSFTGEPKQDEEEEKPRKTSKTSKGSKRRY
jgi:single-strand DNA-binding protein